MLPRGNWIDHFCPFFELNLYSVVQLQSSWLFFRYVSLLYHREYPSRLVIVFVCLLACFDLFYCLYIWVGPFIAYCSLATCKTPSYAVGASTHRWDNQITSRSVSLKPLCKVYDAFSYRIFLSLFGKQTMMPAKSIVLLEYLVHPNQQLRMKISICDSWGFSYIFYDSGEITTIPSCKFNLTKCLCVCTYILSKHNLFSTSLLLFIPAVSIHPLCPLDVSSHSSFPGKVIPPFSRVPAWYHLCFPTYFSRVPSSWLLLILLCFILWFSQRCKDAEVESTN